MNEAAKGFLASLNTQDELCWTALMVACWNMKKAMADLLIERGAEVNRTNSVIYGCCN
jgi:ankyrin repeat protein